MSKDKIKIQVTVSRMNRDKLHAITAVTGKFRLHGLTVDRAIEMLWGSLDAKQLIVATRLIDTWNKK